MPIPIVVTLIILGILAMALAAWDASNGFSLRWGRLFVAAVVIVGIAFFASTAKARDLGQWENSDPAIRQWYKSLMQPDNPNVSCCGEADAYWCDEYYARDGKAYCKITDDRDDAPLGRPHIPIGTEFEIPPHKLKWDRANPTGHAIIFVNTYGHVWCFVQGGGV